VVEVEKSYGADSNVLQDQIITDQIIEAKANRFQRNITEHCNEKFRHRGALMATLVIMRVMQNIIINVSKQLHGSDKAKGREYVETCYGAALKDALTEWDSE
jgi:hypothetical protein